MSKIDESYHRLLQKILDEGYNYKDESRDVNCLQISSYQFVHNLQKDGFPAITTKKLYWKGVVGELLWFLRGETNIKYLLDNDINIWNKDAYNFYKKTFPLSEVSIEDFLKEVKSGIFENVGDLGYIYGAQWRKFSGSYDNYVNGEGEWKDIDQISNLVKGLKENPMSRRHIVTAWNPAELNQMALPPCHWSFEIISRPLTLNERRDIWGKMLASDHDRLDKEGIPRYGLDLKWHQRSVDTFLGLPFNIASYALLAHIIGRLTNMTPCNLIGDLSNVHLYETHIEAAKEQLKRDVNKYDECHLNIVNNYLFDKFTGSPEDLMSNPFENWNYEEAINNVLNNLQIGDFELKYYQSYPIIKTEMIEPKI